MEPKRFYRSRTDKVFAGVCGGLAEYFNTDPILVRLLFLVLIILAGGGLLAYIILWIITPEKPIDFSQFQNSPTMENKQTSNEEPQGSQEKPKNDPFQYPPAPAQRSRKPYRGIGTDHTWCTCSWLMNSFQMSVSRIYGLSFWW